MQKFRSTYAGRGIGTDSRAWASLLLLLLLATAVTGCASSGGRVQHGDVPRAETPRGMRFARADLVDVATYVSEQSGVGFVLADPQLRTVTLSLFHPQEDAEPEQLRDMFLVALEGQGLRLIERNGYWLILAQEAAPGFAEQPIALPLFLTDVPLREATLLVSEISGRTFIVSQNVGPTHLTLQSSAPVNGENAYALLARAVEAEGLSMDDRGDVTVIYRRLPPMPAGEHTP